MSMAKYLGVGTSGPKKRKVVSPKLDGKFIEKFPNGKFSHGYQSTICRSFFTQDEGTFVLHDKKGNVLPAEQFTCSVRGENGTICGTEIVIQKDTGMGNAFKHLLSNHFDGTHDSVVKAYNDALEEANAKGGPLTTYLKCDTITPKEDAIADWI